MITKELLNSLFECIDSLNINVDYGCSKSEAYNIALIYSCVFRCPVAFDFNGGHYDINSKGLIKDLMNK